MVMETLYHINFVSMQTLQDEMKKTSRKVALFSTVVTFSDNGTMFTPDEAEVTEMMLSLLEDMI